MSETGIEQRMIIRDMLYKLDEYDRAKKRLSGVHGLDDDFGRFQEQLERVEEQLKDHMKQGR